MALIAPSELVATVINKNTIHLSWLSHNEGYSNIVVERDSGSGFVELGRVGTVGISSGGTYDYVCVDGTFYSYRVWADYYDEDPSGYSNTATATTPLPCPTGVGAAQVGSTVVISWTNTAVNLTGYNIYEGGVFLVEVIGSPQYIRIGTLLASTTYSWYVTAKNAIVESPASETKSITTPLTPPGVDIPVPNAPSDLVATVLGETSIDITWVNNSTTVTLFSIEMSSPDEGSYAIIATVNSTTSHYTKTGLVNNTHYHFRVRALNDGGYSDYCTTAHATTTATGVSPDPPTALVIHSYTDTTVTLTWVKSANAKEVGYYVVYRVSAGEYPTPPNSPTIIVPFVGAEECKIRGLLSNTLYYFKVCAYNSGALSAYATDVSVTTRSAKTAVSTTSWPCKQSVGILEWEIAYKINDLTWTVAGGGYVSCWYTSWIEGSPSKVIEYNAILGKTVYTLAVSIAACDVAAGTYFYDASAQRLYVHPTGTDIPSTTPNKYTILGYFWERIASHSPVVLNGVYYRPGLDLENVSAINWGTAGYHEGGTALGFGPITFLNADAYFDARLAKYIYEAKYMRFLIGSYTLDSDKVIVTTTRENFTLLWEGWSGNIICSDESVEVETEDLRTKLISSISVGIA